MTSSHPSLLRLALWATLLSLMLSLISLRPCIAQATSYIAAVVEHSPVGPDGSSSTQDEANAFKAQNLEAYLGHALAATTQGVQIIVFPEYGLFSDNFETRDSIYPYLEQIPSVSDQVNPCNDPATYNTSSSVALYGLSCIAANNQINLVADMGEVAYCDRKTDPNCPSDSRYQYNVQVAFSETGTLIGKYRKYHLYNEPYYDVPAVQEIAYFDTSFGVRFGQFICFDLNFEFPSFELIFNESLGITDITYSTDWVNFPPFETAPQAQQGWSRFYSGNLLASGYGGHGVQSSGSGIYSQGKLLATYFNPLPNPSEVLLIAEVPILSSSSRLDPVLRSTTMESKTLVDLPMINNEKRTQQLFEAFELGSLLPLKISTFKATPGSTGSFEFTAGNLTCSGSYSISSTSTSENPQQFAFVALQVFEIPTIIPAPLDYCGFAMCESEIELCDIKRQMVTPTTTFFESLSVSGNFGTHFSTFALASTNGLPIDTEYTTFVPSETENTQFSISSTSEPLALSNFALFSVRHQ